LFKPLYNPALMPLIPHANAGALKWASPMKLINPTYKACGPVTDGTSNVPTILFSQSKFIRLCCMAYHRTGCHGGTAAKNYWDAKWHCSNMNSAYGGPPLLCPHCSCRKVVSFRRLGVVSHKSTLIGQMSLVEEETTHMLTRTNWTYLQHTSTNWPWQCLVPSHLNSLEKCGPFEGICIKPLGLWAQNVQFLHNCKSNATSLGTVGTILIWCLQNWLSHSAIFMSGGWSLGSIAYPPHFYFSCYCYHL
jgi:hypothetical protein